MSEGTAEDVYRGAQDVSAAGMTTRKAPVITGVVRSTAARLSDAERILRRIIDHFHGPTAQVERDNEKRAEFPPFAVELEGLHAQAARVLKLANSVALLYDAEAAALAMKDAEAANPLNRIR